MWHRIKDNTCRSGIENKGVPIKCFRKINFVIFYVTWKSVPVEILCNYYKNTFILRLCRRNLVSKPRRQRLRLFARNTRMGRGNCRLSRWSWAIAGSRVRILWLSWSILSRKQRRSGTDEPGSPVRRLPRAAPHQSDHDSGKVELPDRVDKRVQGISCFRKVDCNRS